MKRLSIYISAATLVALCLFFVSLLSPSSTHAADEPDSRIHLGVKGNGTTSYTIKPGDYLDGIAKAHQISWPSIFEMNDQISNPDVIYPNQQIDIPEQDVSLTRTLPKTNLPIPDGYKQQVSAQRQAAPQPTAPAITFAGSGGIGNAWSLIGSPYRYGGTTPSGFDCSGFTRYIAAQYGVSLPRTVMGQYQATQRISQQQLRPGDLIFFNPHHVGLYVGNGQVIHATNPQQGVRADTFQSAIAYNGYMGAGRY